MKILKRFVLTASLALSLFVPALSVLPAGAQVDISNDVCSGDFGNGEVPAICRDIETAKTTNPIYGKDGILTKALNALSFVVGIIAVAVFMIAGIRMTLSRGDSHKISTSRMQIIYASVGIIIAVASQLTVRFVLGRF